MHRLRRDRRFALVATGAAALAATRLATPSWAQPQAYPNRQITLVVGYPPGGSTDLTGRLVAEELGKALKATVVVENQGGSGGALAAQRVAKAAPDGYTLMMASNNELVINQYINKQIRVDGQTDFTPIALVASQPLVLVATRKAGVRTIQEFVDTVKRHPGKFSYGSAGIGTSLHLLGELVKDKAGLDLVHIPYKGAAPLTTDLLGDNIEYGIFVLSSGLQYIQGGKVTALGTSEGRRSPLTPDVPALGEHPALRGIDVGAWFMLVGPAGLPAPVAGTLRAALAETLKAPALRKKLEAAGSTVIDAPPDLRGYLATEAAKYRRMVELAGITP
jgi:tripartite-type tricarboxylate transporter receptor subunit TctC